MARKDKLVRATAAGALYQLGAQDPHATMILRGIAMDMTWIDRHWWPHHCAAIRVAREHGERIDGDLDLLIAGVGKEAVIEFLHALGELGERADPKPAGALWEVAHSYRPNYLRAAALEARFSASPASACDWCRGPRSCSAFRDRFGAVPVLPERAIRPPI